MENNNYTFKTSGDFKRTALERLKNNWLNAVVVGIIFTLLTEGLNITFTFHDLAVYGIENLDNAGASADLGKLLTFILGGPMALGLVTYYLNLFRDNDSRIEDIFSGFSHFGKTFVLNFLMYLFTFLWILLLIVPGIIAAIKYTMSFYILHDNPEMSAMEAINKSKDLMDGEKLRFFVFYLSFIGWFLLGLITFGIGFIWITPYYCAAKTDFYENLKAKKGL